MCSKYISLWKQYTTLQIHQHWCSEALSAVYCYCHRTATHGDCTPWVPIDHGPRSRGSAVVALGHRLHLLVLGANALTPAVCSEKESRPAEGQKVRESVFLLENVHFLFLSYASYPKDHSIYIYVAAHIIPLHF